MGDPAIVSAQSSDQTTSTPQTTIQPVFKDNNTIQSHQGQQRSNQENHTDHNKVITANHPQQLASPRVASAHVRKNTADLTTEFDFAKGNAKFDKTTLKPAADGSKVVDKSSNLSVEDENGEDGENGAYYEPKKSFFDNISCEATDGQRNREGPRMNRFQERKLNSETFGIPERPSFRGGSGGGYRGGGGGGGRGRGYYNNYQRNNGYRGGGGGGGYNNGYNRGYNNNNSRGGYNRYNNGGYNNSNSNGGYNNNNNNGSFDQFNPGFNNSRNYNN